MEKGGFDDQYMRNLLRAFTHDLRNPLVNMQALTFQMQDALGELHGECGAGAAMQEMDESLTMMAASVERMNALIQGAYELSRAMFEAPECSRIELATLVAAELQQRQGALREKNIRVRADNLPGLWGDEAALRRIVTELLDNAIRYVPEVGGEIVCSVRQRDGMDCLLLEDNGPGVAEASRPGMFDPFFTTESGRRGLGLAMVQALARAHGGHAWYEAGHGQGAVVYVGLPCRREEGRA
jgi:signal transduction histidine kinase